MIQLLFLVLFVEGAVAFLLMVKIGPLREFTMKGLDQLKTGRGPATMKTLACTVGVIFLSSLVSIVKIHNKDTKLGTVTPMEQVLWRTHLLEASLTGYTLFLALVIERLHHYLGKLISLREIEGTSKGEVEKLQKEHAHLKEKDVEGLHEIKSLKAEVASLAEKIQKLKSESDEKDKRAAAAEEHVLALQKQSEDLLLEYDRLLEDNQILQSQSLTFRN